MTNNEAAPEIEVKFFDVELNKMREKLSNTGAILKTPERLMRRIIFGGESNPGMHCTYGRVRDEGGVVTLSAKYSAVDGDINSQREAQVMVDNFEQAVFILEAFGMQVTNYQENKRESWQCNDGTLIELERWPDLPTYVEIEGASITALQTNAAQLGLEWQSHTTDSTDKLYVRHFGLSDAEAEIRLKNLRFS